MARIHPVDETSAPVASRELAAAHAATGGRMTNMKWTLAHSPVALDALLQWYPLFDALVPVVGERRMWILSYAISTQSDCLICSTFFRRLLIDAGEDPASLRLDGTNPGMQAAPILLTALVIGRVVSILQAATQINEATLSFIPKLVAMFVVLVVCGPWMLSILVDYVQRLYLSIPQTIG